MRSIVPRVEKPCSSARRAQATSWSPPAPGTALGSATPTSISRASLPELDSAVTLADDRAQLRAVVAGLDAAYGARTRAHHQRFGAGAGAAVADALQDVAVGDAAGGEEDVLARAEV